MGQLNYVSFPGVPSYFAFSSSLLAWRASVQTQIGIIEIMKSLNQMGKTALIFIICF